MVITYFTWMLDSSVGATTYVGMIRELPGEIIHVIDIGDRSHGRVTG